MRYKGHVFDLYIVDICKDSMSANYFSGVLGFPLSLVSLYVSYGFHGLQFFGSRVVGKVLDLGYDNMFCAEFKV